MPRLHAVYTQLDRQFGQSLSPTRDPGAARYLAADWLATGAHGHQEVLVQACQVERRQRIGDPLIDKIIRADGGFKPGNVSSNLQTSEILGPYWTRLGGGELVRAKMHAYRFEAMLESSWNSAADLIVLKDIGRILKSTADAAFAADVVDEGTTLVRVMHMRDKETRYQFPTPVVTHGWLLTGERGNILHERVLDDSPIGLRMMARARVDLTFERFESRDLLKISGGKVLFVDDEVRAIAESMRQDDQVVDEDAEAAAEAAPRG